MIDELEELIGEVLTSNFTLGTDKKGQVVIFTGLVQDEDGDLSDMEEESSDEDLEEVLVDGEDFDSYDESSEEDDE